METTGRGKIDDEAFRRLIELELSGFGAEEGDSLHLDGRGGGERMVAWVAGYLYPKAYRLLPTVVGVLAADPVALARFADNHMAVAGLGIFSFLGCRSGRCSAGHSNQYLYAR